MYKSIKINRIDLWCGKGGETSLSKDELNIISSIKIIEELKVDLVCNVGNLFKLLNKGANIEEKELLDCITNSITINYLLANRLGMSYKEVDENIRKTLKKEIINKKEIGKKGNDLSDLYDYLNEKE